MNAVEIEEAVSKLAEAPFDAESFPYAFLEAFGNPETTLKRLKSGTTNQSDLGGILQRNHIHLKVCAPGEIQATLEALRASPKTASAKAKFILATDGEMLNAENLNDGDVISCEFSKFADHFGFFLPLAGISTVKQIAENAFDIRATGRLNRLYVELLKTNPDWDTDERRQALNQFFAQLIFCFFAEDTGIFGDRARFTKTVEMMSERDSSNTHEVIGEIFRAMNVPVKHEGNFDDRHRKAAGIKNWANDFPYVNGGLFSAKAEVPKFSKIARSYFLHVGSLDWTKINPDIFGSMIQAVADDEERGALGLHYTSVPNILKVLNPLFLDDLRSKLEEAGESPQKLLNLRKRMARIRVFDPACGSGNFLVIAYKQMREIEAEINKRRGEPDRASDIRLTNFLGIEIRHFSCEIARLALIIAEYQCDVLYRGPQLALAEFLPLEAANWITCGNALRLDWLSVCKPSEKGVKTKADDLFETPLDQSEIDFDNEGGETYICGNPPYKGSKWLTEDQKSELKSVFGSRSRSWRSLDYVSGWFMKAADYCSHAPAAAAFVTTNSICQGQQVPILWPLIFDVGIEIFFAYTSFKWSNLASHNAGVTVVIVGIRKAFKPNSADAVSTANKGLAVVVNKSKHLYSTGDFDEVREVDNINAYLVASANVEIHPQSTALTDRAVMQFGNHPYYGASLIFPESEAKDLICTHPSISRFIRPLYGSKEFISSSPRACLWISDSDLHLAERIPPIVSRLQQVADSRNAAKQDKAAVKLAETPYRFRDQFEATIHTLVVPRVSSENRPYLPVGILSAVAIVQDQVLALYDAPLWNMALIASRLHLVWIGTVCGKLKTDFRYSNTLGWNTFPVPTLTEQNKKDLTRCAEDILLAREAHFPATIADLYDPETMPENLRRAHERNDEVLERIYIGRRFKNDTERLEKLFQLYAEMVAKQKSEAPAKAKKSPTRKKKADPA